jgi:trk system potassium uptake protein TrkA
VTLATDSPAVGKCIADLGVPRDATVVAVIRGDRHVVVPRGETVMEAGDEVLVLVTVESQETVKTLLVGERRADAG